jgi:uncharacterized surface anchored protein
MFGKISACLMAILLLAPWTIGQSTFGSIIAVVKDPGEGTVAGAQITLTNLDDHAQRNTNADSNGAFEFVNLKPGHYEMVIRADGFSDYRVSSLQLDARQNLCLDAALKLATSTQTIEVNGERGPVINTENGTIGDTKDFQQITALPVNYRGATTSPLAMLSTVPGAQQDANGKKNLVCRVV